MIGPLFTIIAPIVICAGLGYLWGRLGQPYDTRLITRLVTMVGAPSLIFSALTKFEITPLALGEVALAALAAVACFAAIGALVLRASRLRFSIFLPPLTFANAGNMGLPLCLFAFGDAGLAAAIGYFAVNATLHYTFGAWLYSARAAPIAALKTPLPYTVAIAVAFLVAGIRPPAWLFNTTNLLGGLTIPLMLLTLGVTLGQFRVTRLPRSVLLGMLRIGMGIGVGLGLAELLGLEGVQRGVVIIEASMPAAVFNYMLAAHYERAPEEAASLVVVSTLISVASLPFVLMLAL